MGSLKKNRDNKSLVDALANEFGLLCSDLHWMDKDSLVKAIIQFNINDYKIKEWNNVLSYLFEMEKPINDIHEVEEFLNKPNIKKRINY